MDMTIVRSSAIHAVGYDHTTRRMRIRFQQGHSYDFCDVPEEVYRGLMDATSKGSYYNRYIKDRFPC